MFRVGKSLIQARCASYMARSNPRVRMHRGNLIDARAEIATKKFISSFNAPFPAGAAVRVSHTLLERIPIRS